MTLETEINFLKICESKPFVFIVIKIRQNVTFKKHGGTNFGDIYIQTNVTIKTSRTLISHMINLVLKSGY